MGKISLPKRFMNSLKHGHFCRPLIVMGPANCLVRSGLSTVVVVVYTFIRFTITSTKYKFQIRDDVPSSGRSPSRWGSWRRVGRTQTSRPEHDKRQEISSTLDWSTHTATMSHQLAQTISIWLHSQNGRVVTQLTLEWSDTCTNGTANVCSTWWSNVG